MNYNIDIMQALDQSQIAPEGHAPSDKHGMDAAVQGLVDKIPRGELGGRRRSR